jgi:leucyl aminopeptidase
MEILTASEPRKGDHQAWFAFEGEPVKVPGVKVAKEEFAGKTGQLLFVRAPDGQRTALAGLGKREEFWPEILRRAAGRSARALRDAACEEFSLVLPEAKPHKPADLARAAAEAVALSLYTFDKYKTKKEPSRTEVKRVRVCGEPLKEVAEGAELGRTLAECANYARSLANEPPNVATPQWMSAQAKSLASRHGLKYDELGYERQAREGLAGIRAVSQGSQNEGLLVSLEYAPKGHEREAPVVVAGKGICFDSGGLDIKPAGQFADMKFDKCGACAVLGILRACAELKLPVRVVGLLALAENLPSGRSYKPSDVLKIGDKTVEVANTDAEGRVVLADALAYAQRYQPRALVDLATLTGAIVSALGDQASGVMGTDQELLDAIGEAGRASGERVWPLPLWPEYVEQVKGEVADLKNLGASGPVGRGMAGAIAGAAFLKHFADPAPWVHVDIAGTSDSKKGTDYLAAGASGVGVRLVTELLRRRYASAARRR